MLIVAQPVCDFCCFAMKKSNSLVKHMVARYEALVLVGLWRTLLTPVMTTHSYICMYTYICPI